ncbi:MAG: NAD-dependent epimerase/dehydratase family protein [Anaerolineales bacterium]|nr:NAD-dependent epimerase/dehydratase family protein [Anaerolineales bacterium]
MAILQSERNVILGTGPLGLAVMDELLARGRQVTLVNRRGQADEPLPDDVKIVAGDVTHPDDVARLCADADVVFQCAQPHYDEWPEKFPPIIDGVLRGVSRTTARLVVGDNLYMYGPTGGAPIDEDLPYAANGRKGRTRALLAQKLLDAHAAGQIQVTMGRASDFYGPRVRDSAAGEIVFAAALAGKTINVLGDPDQPHTYTFIRDFARALVTLSEHSEAFGRAWHVPSAPTVTTRQFVAMVEGTVERPLKIRAAGKLTVSLLGLFNADLREFKEMMYEFEEPYIVDHSQYQAAFGNGVTPHETAIAETVAWYRATA